MKLRLLFTPGYRVDTEHRNAIGEIAEKLTKKISSGLINKDTYGILGNKDSEDLNISSSGASITVKKGMAKLEGEEEFLILDNDLTITPPQDTNWKRLYIHFKTGITSNYQQTNPSTGATIDISYEEITDTSVGTSFGSDTFCVVDTTSFPPDNTYVPLGDIRWNGSSFDIDKSCRKYCQLNVNFFTETSTLRGGGPVTPSVEDGVSLDRFLACKGDAPRTVKNPFGLSYYNIPDFQDFYKVTGNFVTVGLKDDGNPLYSLSPYIYTGGYYLVDTNKNQYLQVSYASVVKTGSIIIPSSIVINKQKVETGADIETDYPNPDGSGTNYSVSFIEGGGTLASKGLWLVYIEYDDTKDPPFRIRRELVFEEGVDDPQKLLDNYAILYKNTSYDWKQKVAITHIRLPGLLAFMADKLGSYNDAYNWWYNEKRLPIAFIWVDHQDVDDPPDGNEEIVFAKVILEESGGSASLDIYNCYQDSSDNGMTFPESTGFITMTSVVPYHIPANVLRAEEQYGFTKLSELTDDLYEDLTKFAKKIDNLTTTNPYYRHSVEDWIEKHRSKEKPLFYEHDASQIKRNYGYKVLDDDHPENEESVDDSLNAIVDFVKNHNAYDYVIITTGDETKDRQAIIDAFAYLDAHAGGSLMIRGDANLNLGSSPLFLKCRGTLYINTSGVTWYTGGSTLDKDIQIIQGQRMIIEGGYFYGQTIRGEEILLENNGGAIHLELRDQKYGWDPDVDITGIPTTALITKGKNITSLFLLGNFKYTFSSGTINSSGITAKNSRIMIKDTTIDYSLYTYGHGEDPASVNYIFDEIIMEDVVVNQQINFAIGNRSASIYPSYNKIILDRVRAKRIVLLGHSTGDFLKTQDLFMMRDCELPISALSYTISNFRVASSDKIVIENNSIQNIDGFFFLDGYDIIVRDNFFDIKEYGDGPFFFRQRGRFVLENNRFGDYTTNWDISQVLKGATVPSPDLNGSTSSYTGTYALVHLHQIYTNTSYNSVKYEPAYIIRNNFGKFIGGLSSSNRAIVNAMIYGTTNEADNIILFEGNKVNLLGVTFGAQSSTPTGWFAFMKVERRADSYSSNRGAILVTNNVMVGRHQGDSSLYYIVQPYYVYLSGGWGMLENYIRIIFLGNVIPGIGPASGGFPDRRNYKFYNTQTYSIDDGDPFYYDVWSSKYPAPHSYDWYGTGEPEVYLCLGIFNMVINFGYY